MSVKKVLVIRFRRIGDAVLSVVICSSIRKSFPEAEIHYVLNDHIAPLFENHPDIDKIITFSDEENNHFFKYLRNIVSEHLNFIIIFFIIIGYVTT